MANDAEGGGGASGGKENKIVLCVIIVPVLLRGFFFTNTKSRNIRVLRESNPGTHAPCPAGDVWTNQSDMDSRFEPTD